MKRRIVVILGSENDLRHCLKGLQWLQEQVAQGKVVVEMVYVRSVHRHTEKFHWLLESLHQADPDHAIDAAILVAGWAAHLPGCGDAYLRYHLQNITIRVIAVAIKGSGWLGWLKTLAAILSITQVPGHQMKYAGSGPRGFLNACKMAVQEPLWKINLKEVPPTLDLSLERAIELASQQ